MYELEKFLLGIALGPGCSFAISEDLVPFNVPRLGRTLDLHTEHEYG